MGVSRLGRSSASLPSGVRVLLLSVAVVDDLLAITRIALVFTAGVSLTWVAAVAVVSALYWLAFRHRVDRACLLWALALVVWVCVHASGVHATVAGIVLGLLTPVRARPGEEESPSEHLEHRLHPMSAGIAVPIFALAAAGIPLAVAGDALDDQVALGVFAGLLVGKVVGILGGAQVAVRCASARSPRTSPGATSYRSRSSGRSVHGRRVDRPARPRRRRRAGARGRERADRRVIASLVALVLLRRRSRAR
jgi:NhaA family Na+:H+ antiporter